MDADVADFVAIAQSERGQGRREVQKSVVGDFIAKREIERGQSCQLGAELREARIRDLVIVFEIQRSERRQSAQVLQSNVGDSVEPLKIETGERVETGGDDGEAGVGDLIAHAAIQLDEIRECRGDELERVVRDVGLRR